MTEPVDITPPPPAKKYSFADYLFQFVTITAGVLIALLINGLVRMERTTGGLSPRRARRSRRRSPRTRRTWTSRSPGIAGDMKQLDNAIKFANDMLTAKKTAINELKLHLNFADVSSAGWRTAERTGALSHMPYAEVQRYSLLYDLQDLSYRTAAQRCSSNWRRRRRFSAAISTRTSPTPGTSRHFGSG